MENLIQLLGLALPNTATMFRVKILCAGICGICAGLLLTVSGLDGMAMTGGSIAACGAALTGLAGRDLIREARRRKVRLVEQRLRREDEARRDRERTLREDACIKHDWILDDQGLNYDVCQWRCLKCGAFSEHRP